MNKVDWWVKSLLEGGGVQNASFKIAAKQCLTVKKLSDEKVAWWESLKGITNGRTNGRTLLTLESLRDWKEIYPEINLISNLEHHEAWSCLKCDVSHLYCNSNEHHQSSPINDWWCSWLLIWLICGYISIMDMDRQTDRQANRKHWLLSCYHDWKLKVWQKYYLKK